MLACQFCWFIIHLTFPVYWSSPRRRANTTISLQRDMVVTALWHVVLGCDVTARKRVSDDVRVQG